MGLDERGLGGVVRDRVGSLDIIGLDRDRVGGGAAGGGEGKGQQHH